jgi:nicotinate-nucleotide adenylyltransferase
MKPIGIFGGTFDPVHLGHLRSALELLEQLELTQVRFIPSARPPHRPPTWLSAEKRLRLLQAAVAEQPEFIVDDCELEREGVSYTVDTLIKLRDQFGQTPLCLLLGGDAFAMLPTWSRWEQIFELAHVVVVRRPGAEEPVNLSAILQDRRIEDKNLLHTRASGCIYSQQVTALDISATQIRALWYAGRSIRYLVPDPVWHLLQSEDFYK